MGLCSRNEGISGGTSLSDLRGTATERELREQEERTAEEKTLSIRYQLETMVFFSPKIDAKTHSKKIAK